MNLKRTRVLLSLFFAFVIIVGNCVFTGSILVKSILCNDKYIEKAFKKEHIIEVCDKNFSEEIDALCAQSGIPKRVFMTAKDMDKSDSRLAIERFFDNHDTSMYNKERVEIYESLCKEYLDGNNIEYSNIDIHRTAERAAEIYAQSYGLINTEFARNFIDNVKADYSKYNSFGISLVAVSILILVMLYSDRKNAYSYIFSAFTATGVSYLLISLASLMTGVGKNPSVFPEFYAAAITSSVRGMFWMLFFIGVIVTALSSFLLVSHCRLTKFNNK